MSLHVHLLEGCDYVCKSLHSRLPYKAVGIVSWSFNQSRHRGSWLEDLQAEPLSTIPKVTQAQAALSPSAHMPPRVWMCFVLGDMGVSEN